MKKIITLFLICVSINCYAITDWTFRAYGQIGQYENRVSDNELGPASTGESIDDYKYGTSSVGASFQWVWADYSIFKYFSHEVYYDCTSYFIFQDYNKRKHYPIRDIYTCGTKLKIGCFYAGYEHYCSHPVMSNCQGQNTTEWEHNRWCTNGDLYTIGFEVTIKGQ